MFSLTIVFGPGPMVWTLMFKTEEAVISVADYIERNHDEGYNITLKDDFGQIATVNTKQLHGFMREDLEQSRLAHIERALHQARTQAKGQEIADADPTLRQARMKAQGGMPMIQPMSSFRPNGGFPG